MAPKKTLKSNASKARKKKAEAKKTTAKAKVVGTGSHGPTKTKKAPAKKAAPKAGHVWKKYGKGPNARWMQVKKK